MRVRWRPMKSVRWCCLLVVAGLEVTACGGDDQPGGSCPVGSERCACTQGQACDPGLRCLSNVCVRDDAGAGGRSGSAGMAGSAGSAGTHRGGDGGRAGSDASGGDSGEAGAAGAGKGGRTGTGGRNAGGRSGAGTGGRAGDSGGAGDAGEGGATPSIYAEACDAKVRRMVDAADGTACTIDVERELARCIENSTGAEACVTEQLAALACYAASTHWECVELEPGQPGDLAFSGAECNDAIIANDECQQSAVSDPACVSFAAHAKALAPAADCESPEIFLMELYGCRQDLERGCVAEARSYYGCLAEEPVESWSCSLPVLVPDSAACAIEADERAECLLADADPTCAALVPYLVDTAEAVGCAGYTASDLLLSCSESLESSCGAEIRNYFECVTGAPTEDWSCDSYSLDPSPSLCTVEQDFVVDCQECACCETDRAETIGASLVVSADDRYSLWVNGSLVDDEPHGWNEPHSYTVTLNRHPTQPNVIAIVASNLYGGDGLDRGVIAALGVTPASDYVQLFTDGKWRVTDEEPDASWIDLDWDDSGWPFAVPIADYPDPPWNSIGGSFDGAKWIWSYVPGLAVDKPATETIYLRRTFYITASGHIADTPERCTP